MFAYISDEKKNEEKNKIKLNKTSYIHVMFLASFYSIPMVTHEARLMCVATRYTRIYSHYTTDYNRTTGMTNGYSICIAKILRARQRNYHRHKTHALNETINNRQSAHTHKHTQTHSMGVMMSDCSALRISEFWISLWSSVSNTLYLFNDLCSLFLPFMCYTYGVR